MLPVRHLEAVVSDPEIPTESGKQRPNMPGDIPADPEIPGEAVAAAREAFAASCRAIDRADYDDSAPSPMYAALTAALPALRQQWAARDEALAAEVEPWLNLCGSCDAALPMNCTCPEGDYRNILLKVWQAYEAAITVREFGEGT